MLTRLGYYADKALEVGWLAAAIFVPLFFNVYSSRVFEPDKIALMRSLALLMTLAWLVKLAEGGWRAWRDSVAAPARGRLGAALEGAAESGLPSWLGFLRVPMVLPILVYALVYFISSIFTMTPDATWWGSYQRLQGTYTQYSYMMLGIIVIANLRRRVQLERLINFIILASAPVALYGLLQANRLDPLPWAGDTATRVASTMGNAIFVAAWLIMTVPLTLYRFLNGVSATLAARNTAATVVEDGDGSRGRRPARIQRIERPDYGWAVAANVAGLLMAELLLFGFVLKLISSLPLPNAQLWPAFPLALVVFYFGCWGIEWFNSRRYDPAIGSTYLWGVGALLFFAALLTFVPSWSIGPQNQGIDFRIDVIGFLWVLFFLLVWASIAATLYALGGNKPATSPDRSILRSTLNVAYGALLFVQIVCIYLTQSRGPWLGLGVGLVVFAVGLWLVGRKRHVRWMERIGGTASALVLVGAIFVGLLNIPGSPLQSLGNLPVVGRGVERLSTLTRTEDGTGKVRTLIWQGATALIASEPIRTIIGYGPEAMYVVYNKYYPPELAHWELRNATPDRSHNVEFDHMVTMGVMGLLAYYFIVGSFLFFGIRVIKRARNTHDQLLAIALVAVISAHFVEIQTGIQIAATWTYFYLTIGMMVAFGFFITNYLRKEELAPEEAVAYGQAESERIAELRQPSGAAPAETRQPVGAVAAGVQKSVTASVSGNGRPPAGQAANGANGPRSRSRTGAPNQPGTGTARVSGRDSGYGSQGSRPRQSQHQPRMQVVTTNERFLSNPAFAFVYAALLLAALVFIWKVNVATVEADTLYKQGQAYDNAQQWSNSISRYQAAIALQPGQDYYYLFLGRAFLEWAKVTDQDLAGNDQSGKPKYTQQQIDAERTARLQAAQQQLMHARDLNPLNTDHYANLGRLYLYWADPTGGKDDSKAPLAEQYMQEAVNNSPGNAQLWDELAVAQARNGHFQKAMESLQFSQDKVDSTYQRTPFIRGQLLEDRANAVKTELMTGQPLPTGGETDYGKLVIQAGQAYSSSIKLDPSYFVDNGMQNRLEFFFSAGDPFTNTNSTIPTPTLKNVLTDTILLAYKQQMPLGEKAVADTLRNSGVYKGTEEKVPSTLLQQLWNDPAWAGVAPGQPAKQWLDANLKSATTQAVVPYAALGFAYYRLGDTQAAIDAYQRAVDLDPSNYFNQKNLGSLLTTLKDCKGAISHLQTALSIVSAQPDLQTDQNRQGDYQNIQKSLQDAQAQTDCK